MTINHRPPLLASQKCFHRCLVTLLFFLPSVPWVCGYYVGEPVDTALFSGTTGAKTPALISQRPLFGIDSTVTVPRDMERFSLAFEEGYHQLSWFDIHNLGKLQVTFVHSKSGDGAIHSVFSQPIMKTLHGEYSRHHMEIEYRWIEEQAVDLHAGSIIMFLATLAFSLVLIFHAMFGTSTSSSDDDDYISEERQDSDENPSTIDFQKWHSLALHAD